MEAHCRTDASAKAPSRRSLALFEEADHGRHPRSPIPGAAARRATDCTGCLGTELLHANPHMIALPGAWAMGDGMILETDLPPKPVGHRRRAASMASYTTSSGNGGNLSENIYRIAGSFTASMSGYIQDLANWAAEYPGEGHREDEVTVDGGGFFDGGQLLFPRSNSCPKAGVGSPGAAATSKKHD